MKRRFPNIAKPLVVGLLLFAIALLAANAAYPAVTTQAQGKSQSSFKFGADPAHPPRLASISQAIRSDTSPALRNIPPVPARPQQADNDNDLIPNTDKGANVKDTVRQSTMGPLAMPTPIITWEGMYNQYGPIPPDPNGDVGRTQYVQLVNSGVQVFDKNTGASLFGPVNLNTLWYNFGGLCETYNNGDPIVLYDAMADRWMLSQFAYASTSGPTYQCIAISTSPDATGSYYRYAFQSTAVGFDDYPHYGVWPDGYYMTANRFGGPNGFAGANIAYERPRMLVGDPTARMVAFEVVGNGGALPADHDGLTPPPAGSPNYIWYNTDASIGLIEEYKFHVDWVTPANSTFTGPFAINVAPWDDDLCSATRERCIPQPGTTAQLEAIADRFMFRLAYRNMGSYETLTTNHTVDGTGTGVAGMRWYEVRDPNGARTVVQQGTYAPNDGLHRWMGSIAMDRMGNMAAGYSVSSSTVFPSIRYAGRLASDPPNQFTQGEATLWAGSGSEDFPAAPRWGDYSSMSVDPVDDCTFYYTTEYFAQTGLRNWRTRIGSFRFPSCTGGTPTPVATSTAGASTTPLPPTATPCPGGVNYTGTITNTDITQTGRLGVGSPPSSCAAPQPVPGFSDTLPRHSDVYPYTNNTGAAQCVTVYVTQACGDNAVQSIAYLGTFDPNNIQANYLAHGGAAGPSYQYSFTVPAGQTVQIVMVEVSPNLGCSTYSLSINSCAQGTPSPTVATTATNTPVVTPSVTPTTVCTGTNYQAFGSSGATIIPGTNDIGNHCDDCLTTITLPFTVNVYGTPYTTAGVGTNGLINFGSSQFNIYLANCLPVVSQNPQFSNTLFPYYDDLRTDVMSDTHGIYTATVGTPPNRDFIVEWRTTYYENDNLTANFEVIFHENSSNIDYVYGQTATIAEGANPATGIQKNLGQYTSYSCHTDLPAGLRVTYVPIGCNITPTTTPMPPTATRTATSVVTSVATATSTACTITFTDVDESNVFYPFIRCLACRGVLGGYDDGTFRPFNDITRGQIAKVVSNAAGFDEDPGAQIYEDVDANNPFYQWINRLSMRGHMGGYPCGTIDLEPCIEPGNRPYFRPFNNATRGQLAKIVANAANVGGTPTGIFYTDVQEDNPFYVWIMRLTNLGVMSGYECGGPGEPCDNENRPYFRPFNNVTRGQAAKIVANTFFPGCETPVRR